MKYRIAFMLLTAMMLAANTVQAKKNKSAFVIVSDYVKPNGGMDVADKLQKLIDENPQRTLYFSDGVYLLSHSLLTPANPAKAVHLKLGNFAVLKATENWQSKDEALVRLGGKDEYHRIDTLGTNYGIEGGIFDGSDVADGISIDAGRESRINHVSIKHVRIGIHLKKNPKYASSDADIKDVNVVGNNEPNSIGVLVEGYDNTVTNMRIASVNKGIWCKSGGNSFRNIHPLYIFNDKQDYQSSCGFIVEEGNNWLDFCYSDQMATGFKLGKGAHVNMTDCFCMWYSGKIPFETVIECNGTLEADVYALHTGFHQDCKHLTLLKAEKGGKGQLVRLQTYGKLSDEDVSESYLVK